MILLDNDKILKKEDLIRQEIQDLSIENKKSFYAKTEKKIKDPDTYAVLNWLLLAGLHHFYLQKWTQGIINLTLFVISVFLIFSEYTYWGIGLLVAIFVFELKELFQSQKIVLNYNNEMMEKVIQDLEKDS